jgi:hypothetical protein
MIAEIDPEDEAWRAQLARELDGEPEEPDALPYEPEPETAPAPVVEPAPALPEAPAPGAPPQGADSWHTYDAAWLVARPLVEHPMVCPRLEIGRGRPCGLVGAAGAGKNDVAQAIALAVATGKPVWGLAACTHGRVLHISYDLGRTSIALRYRRIANGAGISPNELAGRIEICDHPKHNLCTKGARALFAARMRGFDFVLIDNLRSAAPEGDENSSEFGAFVATLGEAAGDAETTVLYLHHTGKDGGGSGRGSSAIQANSGAIWNLAKDGACRKLTQERQHDDSDEEQRALWISREVLPVGCGPFDVGKRTSWRYVASESKPKSPKDAAAELRKQILAAVGKKPDCSATHVIRAVGGKSETVLALIHALVKDGSLENAADSDDGAMRLSVS